jgi:hypothetical protein
MNPIQALGRVAYWAGAALILDVALVWSYLHIEQGSTPTIPAITAAWILSVSYLTAGLAAREGTSVFAAAKQAIAIVALCVLVVIGACSIGAGIFALNFSGEGVPSSNIAFGFGTALIVAFIIYIFYVRRAPSMRWRRAVIAALSVIGLLIMSPILVGFPGWLGARVVASTLRVGISRVVVDVLFVSTGSCVGYDYGGQCYGDDPRTLDAHYSEWTHICIVESEDVHVVFGPNDRVQSWTIEPQSESC